MEPAHRGFAPAGDFLEHWVTGMRRLWRTTSEVTVKGFKIVVPGLMEIDQNRHDFTEGQPAGALACTVGQELAMPVGGGEGVARSSGYWNSLLGSCKPC